MGGTREKWEQLLKRGIDICASVYHRITMRTTITIDDEAYEAALTLSKSSGQRVGAVISQLIRRAMRATDRPAPKSGKRFPTFDVPQGTSMISLRSLRRAWEEE
jgi:hypothetical protein